MPKGGGRDRFDIVKAYVESAMGEGADFARENEGLAATGAAAEAEILAGDWSGGIGSGMRGQNETHGVVFHMRRDGDVTDKLH